MLGAWVYASEIRRVESDSAMSHLRFLHIPKTAGTTFQNVLFRQCRPYAHFAFSGSADLDAKRFRRLAESEKRRVRLFVGHAPITTGLAEADNAQIITFLREPISRVRSFCQHVSEGKSPYLNTAASRGAFDLDEFLESGNAELGNLQTQMLIGDWRSDSYFSIDQLSPPEARDMALENLRSRVAHFGLQERFDESLLIFKHALGWSYPLYYSKNKKNRGRSLEFRPRHLERIEQLNSIDIEVYRAAESSFAEVVQESGIRGGKLTWFQFLQRMFSATEPWVRGWRRLGRLARHSRSQR